MAKSDNHKEPAKPRSPDVVSREEDLRLALQTGRPPASKKRSATRRKLNERASHAPSETGRKR